jgi:SAM-dependent methyltransferase
MTKSLGDDGGRPTADRRPLTADRRASELAAVRGEPSYVWRAGQERRLAMVGRWADLSGDILDVGCGLGAYLEAFGRTSSRRFGTEIELERAAAARTRATGVAAAAGEALPFPDDAFDLVFSNEVIEHVTDDARTVAEMVRVCRPGGKVVIFCPNRWYPVEQHGVYWRGEYKFGNIPLVNYLPLPLRNRLAPHVRTYTAADLRRLLIGLPVEIVHHGRIFGGYDNIEYRLPRLGRWIKRLLYAAEGTPLETLGLSHFLVLRKIAGQSNE